MSGHIKNFQLAYESKPTVFPARGRRADCNRSLLREINVLKIFSRTNKATSFSQKESKETVESEQRREGERERQGEKLMVVSKLRNTSQIQAMDNLTKNFKVHRQRIKTFVSDLAFRNQRSQKTIKCYSGQDLIKGVKSTEKMERHNLPGRTIDDQKSEILITRKSLTNSCTLNKEKYNSSIQEGRQGDRLLDSKPKKQQKTLSSGKIQEKKHAVLPSNAPELKSIKSESFIVVEYPTERTIVSHRATLPGQIASLTKIMTFYTVLHIAAARNVDIRTATVKVSDISTVIGGTTADLMQGQEYTIEQLLYGLMLPSGNDAASELALWGGGLLAEGQKVRQVAFVGEMNKQARVLGLKHTQFGNPHGLPSQCARSTAADIARLCCRCMKNLLFRRIVATRTFRVAVKGLRGTRVVQWENTNKLLRREGFIGLKTGITATAGPCLASAYVFRGKTYISVVLRAPKVSSRFKETRQLLFWTMSRLFKDLSEEQYMQLRALKRENYQLDSDYSDEEEQFTYGNNSLQERQRRCNILDDL